MRRMTVAEANCDLPALVDHDCTEGITIELERDDKVVARLTPAVR